MNIQTQAIIKKLEERVAKQEAEIKRLESLIKYHMKHGNHTDQGPIMYGYDTVGMTNHE